MARSRQDIADMVAGAGLVASIFTELVDAVQELGGTADDVQPH